MSGPDQPDRTCPDWCTHHSRLVNEWGDHAETCASVLFETHPPLAPDNTRPTASLYVSATTVHEGSTIPAGQTSLGMGMSVFDSIPWGVQPEDARALAAALIRGAELVEASRTATCPECRRHVHPGDIGEDSGVCFLCELERRRSLREMMRASVRPETP
jgi:hypothetical protein